MCIHMYIYTCLFIYIYTHFYIIYREREIEREREKGFRASSRDLGNLGRAPRALCRELRPVLYN